MKGKKLRKLEIKKKKIRRLSSLEQVSELTAEKRWDVNTVKSFYRAEAVWTAAIGLVFTRGENRHTRAFFGC